MIIPNNINYYLMQMAWKTAVVINDNAKRLHMETSSLDNDLGIEEFEKKLEASNKQVQQNTTILQDAASKLTYTLDDDVELED
ncbi:unnamed protein product [Rhizophagus irregularis]|nr:unnamed protein product [Rhizophagus irregularis]CAB5360971.1 unnamed protein product [Rhizophagus irregularis]